MLNNLNCYYANENKTHVSVSLSSNQRICSLYSVAYQVHMYDRIRL